MLYNRNKKVKVNIIHNKIQKKKMQIDYSI